MRTNFLHSETSFLRTFRGTPLYKENVAPKKQGRFYELNLESSKGPFDSDSTSLNMPSSSTIKLSDKINQNDQTENGRLNH